MLIIVLHSIFLLKTSISFSHSRIFAMDGHPEATFSRLQDSLWGLQLTSTINDFLYDKARLKKEKKCMARQEQVFMNVLAWYNQTQMYLVNGVWLCSIGYCCSRCILMGVDFGFILKPLDQPLTDRHWPLWDLYTSYFATNGASWYISLFPNPVYPLMNKCTRYFCFGFNSSIFAIVATSVCITLFSSGTAIFVVTTFRNKRFTSTSSHLTNPTGC